MGLLGDMNKHATEIKEYIKGYTDAIEMIVDKGCDRAAVDSAQAWDDSTTFYRNPPHTATEYNRGWQKACEVFNPVDEIFS